jgi:hypothetical protein
MLFTPYPQYYPTGMRLDRANMPSVVPSILKMTERAKMA